MEMVRYGIRGSGQACKAIPLPLAAAQSRKSLIGADNLADFLCTTAIAPRAANQTFVIGDNEDISTTELIRRLAGAMNRPVRLFRIPRDILNLAAKLTHNEKTMTRLVGSLVVDSRKAGNMLGWYPPVTLDDGLSRTAAWYVTQYAGKR
jgi:UDP-glucose 4-epimerase